MFLKFPCSVISDRESESNVKTVCCQDQTLLSAPEHRSNTDQDTVTTRDTETEVRYFTAYPSLETSGAVVTTVQPEQTPVILTTADHDQQVITTVPSVVTEQTKIFQPLRNENISQSSRDEPGPVDKQQLNLASSKNNSSSNVESFPPDSPRFSNKPSQTDPNSLRDDLRTDQDDLKLQQTQVSSSEQSNEVAYSYSTENTRMLAKVKLNLESNKEMGREDAEDRMRPANDVMDRTPVTSDVPHSTSVETMEGRIPQFNTDSSTLTRQPTAMQDDRNMTFISSEFLTSSPPPSPSLLSNEAAADYEDYYGAHYYHPDYYYHYDQATGHLNDASDAADYLDDEEDYNDEEIIEQQNDIVSSKHPVEAFPVSTETNGAVIEEEIDDIHDEDESDTPNNEQEQYYDITDRPELNSHETTTLITDTKTNDDEDAAAMDVHDNNNNNEKDDNIEIVPHQSDSVQIVDKTHSQEITNNVPSLNSANTNIMASHYPDDASVTETEDDHADIDNEIGDDHSDHDHHHVVTSAAPNVAVESQMIHQPLLTLKHQSSQSLRLLITPSCHVPHSEVKDFIIQSVSQVQEIESTRCNRLHAFKQ